MFCPNGCHKAVRFCKTTFRQPKILLSRSATNHPALFDTSFTLRQLHFVKGDCVRASMSDYYGFRVESKGCASVRD